jgi:hypothetical protein
LQRLLRQCRRFSFVRCSFRLARVEGALARQVVLQASKRTSRSALLCPYSVNRCPSPGDHPLVNPRLPLDMTSDFCPTSYKSDSCFSCPQFVIRHRRTT